MSCVCKVVVFKEHSHLGHCQLARGLPFRAVRVAGRAFAVLLATQSAVCRQPALGSTHAAPGSLAAPKIKLTNTRRTCVKLVTTHLMCARVESRPAACTGKSSREMPKTELHSEAYTCKWKKETCKEECPLSCDVRLLLAAWYCDQLHRLVYNCS